MTCNWHYYSISYVHPIDFVSKFQFSLHVHSYTQAQDAKLNIDDIKVTQSEYIHLQ